MHTFSSLYTLETMMGFTVGCLTLLHGHTPFFLVQSTLLILLAKTLNADSSPTVDPQCPPDQSLNAQMCLPAACHHAPATWVVPEVLPSPSALPPPSTKALPQKGSSWRAGPGRQRMGRRSEKKMLDRKSRACALILHLASVSYVILKKYLQARSQFP